MSRGFILTAFMAIILGFGAVGQAQSVPPGFIVETLVSSGLNAPHGFFFLPDGRPVIFERAGGVKLFVNGSLSTIGTVPQVETGSERGLLAMVADPAFATNGYIYAWAARTGSAFMWLMRFTCTGDLNNPTSSNLTFSSTSLFTVFNGAPDNAFNHNGGSLAFGNDGKLIVSMGDDANSCTARSENSAQGVLLRLDVSGLPAGPGTATIAQIDPGDNPSSGSGSVSALVMAKGLRNPWRFTYDAVGGNIYLADVGQNAREEFDEVVYPPATTIQDFGWPLFEGIASFSSCPGGPFPNLIAPTFDVTHGQGWLACITGPRYRNQGGPLDFGPTYEGQWFYTDYFSGQIRRAEFNGTSWVNPAPVPGQASSTNWGTGFTAISQFDMGPDGAMYFTQHAGTYSTSGGSFKRIRPLGPVDVVTVTSGDGQVGVRGKAFKLPVVFQVDDGNGNPLVNTAVTLTSTNATLSVGPQVMTDAMGQVSVTVTPLGQGSVSVSASTANFGAATATLFARGLNVIHISGSVNDTLVVQMTNTTNGTAPVPVLFGMTTPPGPTIPTIYGDLGIDLITLQNTIIIEDGGGLYGGVSNSPGGPFGNPSKTAIYTFPAGSAAGLTVNFQAIWYDPTVLTSIAGTVDSNLGFTNIVTMTF